VKSKNVIERRLRTLRLRYLKKYIAISQDKIPQNCIYNIIHSPVERPNISQFKELDYDEMAACHNATLIVIQPDLLIHICTYGSERPDLWNGEICDTDITSKGCKHFQPRIMAEEAKKEFLSKLSDDEYVYDNYPDIATLQWVLEDRVYKYDLSWWEKILVWFGIKQLKEKLNQINLHEDEENDDITSDTGT
jgi:hypothetical protein